MVINRAAPDPAGWHMYPFEGLGARGARAGLPKPLESAEGKKGGELLGGSKGEGSKSPHEDESVCMRGEQR